MIVAQPYLGRRIHTLFPHSYSGPQYTSHVCCAAFLGAGVVVARAKYQVVPSIPIPLLRIRIYDFAALLCACLCYVE
jgi:hypothetical protein